MTADEREGTSSSERPAERKGPGRKPGGEKPVIGWREWVALPGLGIPAVKAKIDTGARSSALHAFDVELFEEDGVEMVHFKVHPIQRDAKTTYEAVVPLHERRWVRSSSGRRQLRPVIRTTVHVLGILFEIDLTLTRRDAMGFRMLLGREAVRGRFLVDPGRSYRSEEPVARPRAKRKSRKRR